MLPYFIQPIVFSRTSIARRRLAVVEREGLYYLENVSQQTHKGTLACLANEHIHDKNKKKIWLLHRIKIGTSLFWLSKKLFSSLFHKCNISDFVCETCVMAKSHCVVFPLSNKKNRFSFFINPHRCLGPCSTIYT